MKRWAIFIFLMVPLIGLAQVDFTTGVLPEINISYKRNHWRITGQFESMQSMYTRSENESSNQYNYIRSDLTTFLSYKISPSWSVAAGYLNRWTEGTIVQRTIQQVSFVQPTTSLRIGHRLRTDQTFTENSSTSIRLRYRIASEIPLSGKDLNDREWYLKGSLEWLNQFEKTDFTVSYRLVHSIGYFINRAHKVETGIDFRHTPHNEKEVDTWWSINYYANFK